MHGHILFDIRSGVLDRADSPCGRTLQLQYFGYELERFYQANFPADSDGKLCGIDNSKYEYVYFTYPPDIVPIILCIV